MRIGNVDLGDKPVLLAPMEDVTDASFRVVCKKFGADMVYTEFIPSDGLIRDAAKAIAKMKTSDEELRLPSRFMAMILWPWSRLPRWRTMRRKLPGDTVVISLT